MVDLCGINVGKYTIHGWYGKCKVTSGFHIFFTPKKGLYRESGKESGRSSILLHIFIMIMIIIIIIYPP